MNATLEAIATDLSTFMVVRATRSSEAPVVTGDQHALLARYLEAFESYDVAGLVALDGWATRLEAKDAMGPVEAGILRIGFAEYLNRIIHGLPMGQTETVRPHELGTSLRAMGMATDPTLNALFADPDLPEIRMATALAMSEHGFSDPADDPDGEISMMRAQYQRFAEAEIAPFCHRWHLDDVLIPDETVQKVADMGTFAITIPQAYDGLGLSKQAMVAVTEELSSFHLPTGSLATRPEIAGELISNSGTQDQKDRFLPGIASGKLMTTAVFTEPDIGSDLAHLSTRAVRRRPAAAWACARASPSAWADGYRALASLAMPVSRTRAIASGTPRARRSGTGSRATRTTMASSDWSPSAKNGGVPATSVKRVALSP